MQESGEDSLCSSFRQPTALQQEKERPEQIHSETMCHEWKSSCSSFAWRWFPSEVGRKAMSTLWTRRYGQPQVWLKQEDLGTSLFEAWVPNTSSSSCLPPHLLRWTRWQANSPWHPSCYTSLCYRRCSSVLCSHHSRRRMEDSAWNLHSARYCQSSPCENEGVSDCLWCQTQMGRRRGWRGRLGERRFHAAWSYPQESPMGTMGRHGRKRATAYSSTVSVETNLDSPESARPRSH